MTGFCTVSRLRTCEYLTLNTEPNATHVKSQYRHMCVPSRSLGAPFVRLYQYAGCCRHVCSFSAFLVSRLSKLVADRWLGPLFRSEAGLVEHIRLFYYGILRMSLGYTCFKSRERSVVRIRWLFFPAHNLALSSYN